MKEKNKSKLRNQIGLCFLLSFGLAMMLAQSSKLLGLNLTNHSDFTTTAALIALSVLLSILSMQIVVLRPIEKIIGSITNRSNENDIELPSFTSREIQTIHKTIKRGSNSRSSLAEAQAEVKKKEVQMKGIVNSSLDSVVLINSEGAITEWNKQAEDTFGWSREEAIGNEISEMIIPHKLRSAHHEGMDKYHKTKTGPVINTRVEVPAVNRAGDEFPVELTVTPFEIENENYFSAFIRDISDRKKAEQVLALEQQRLSVTLSSMAEGVVVTNNDGKIILSNPVASSLLLAKEDITDQNFAELINDKAFVKQWEKSETHSNELINVTFTQNEKEDQIIAATTSSLSIENEENEPKTIGRVTILRDATKEEQINRMKTDFVSSVSHELRTPLTSIKGFAATMLKKGDAIDGKTRNEFLQIISEETDRLESLIQDLLEISVLDSGKIKLNLSQVSLKELISKIESIALPEAENKSILFTTNCSFDKTITADQDKLHTSILNLATNAIKFTPENGNVSIDVAEVNEKIVIKIKDTGLGIPKRDLENIFERFFRVSRPGTEIQGTGLGLAIVKEMIELHGGTIKADSNLGEGSCFTVEL